MSELEFPFFPEFQLAGKQKIFKNFPGMIPKILWIPGIREISGKFSGEKFFSGKFPDLDWFASFCGFQHFRSNF